MNAVIVASSGMVVSDGDVFVAFSEDGDEFVSWRAMTLRIKGIRYG